MKQKFISISILIIILTAAIYPTIAAQAAANMPPAVDPFTNPDGSTTYDDTDAMFSYHNGSSTVTNITGLFGGSAQTVTGTAVDTNGATGNVTINYHGGDFYLNGVSGGTTYGVWLVKVDGIVVPVFKEWHMNGVPIPSPSETYRAAVGDHVVELYCGSTCLLDGITIFPTSTGILEKGIWIDSADPSLVKSAPPEQPEQIWSDTTDAAAYQTTLSTTWGGVLDFRYYGGDFRVVTKYITPPPNGFFATWHVYDDVSGGATIGGWTDEGNSNVNQRMGPTIHLNSVGWHTIHIVTTDYYATLDAIVILGLTDCSTQYISTPPESTGLPIIPTVENPMGFPGGGGSDQQKQHTITGQYFMIKIKGGPWDDGAGNADRYDTAISWDGTNYTPLSSATSLCTQIDPFHTDLVTVYVQAVSDTLYIRVNDTAGAFANNVAVSPLTYDFSWAWQIGNEPPPCASSFSYSSENWVASISLNSASDDVPINTPLVAGDWYVVEVASGSWTDNGSAPRYDMQYAFRQPSALDLTWNQLVPGNKGVQCSTTDKKTTFIQADTTELHLRANDQDNNFSNNNGHLGINIYHATYTAPIAACEATYQIADLASTGSVNADQEGGVVAGISWGPNSQNPPSGSLVPGGWYALETTGGPWRGANGATGTSYELAISVDDSAWTNLKDWTGATCVVPTDALGHVKVYFQVPSAPATYTLRVNDSGNWSDNSGSMGWNLYEVSDMQIPAPSGSCDYITDFGHKLSDGVVDPTRENGSMLDQGTAQNPMMIGQYYAVRIFNTYKWHENPGDAGSTALQISDDAPLDGSSNGTWHDLPAGYSRVLCYMNQGSDLVFFIKYYANTFRMRAASTSFANNTGMVEYGVYPATPGDTLSPWVTCFAGDTPYLINSGEYIPVKDETGTYINGTLSQGALVVGETYEVKTQNGPWDDGDGNNNRYDVSMSSDGGQTWHLINKDFTDLTCAKQDQLHMYWKIFFTVKSGQQWKIRVNDTEGNFGNNGGNMGYAIYALSGEDVPGLPPGGPVLTGGPGTCDTPLVRPTSILDVPSWIDYWGTSFQQFLLWCPRHTNALLAISDYFNTREPFASIKEMQKSIVDVRTQLNAYNWSDPNAPPSIITSSNPNFDVIPQVASPWNGGPLIDFHGGSIEGTPFYGSCIGELSAAIGYALGRGVCWGSAWARETGASFMIQLSLDVGMALLLISHIWNTVMDLWSMLTGIARQARVSHVMNVFGKAGDR